MNKLIEYALASRRIILAIFCLFLIAGGVAWLNLKKEAYPDVGDTQVTIISQFSGRAAREVEQQVTIPLERVLNSIPNVISRRSKTIFGLSVIQITFDDGVDDYFARQRVFEKLNEAELPPNVHTELAPLTGPIGEVFRYVIEASPNYPLMQLRTLQDWVVIPRLMQVQGVADVINFGGLIKQFHIVTSPEKLARFRLKLSDVIDAVQSNNVNTGGNIIPRGSQGFALRAMGAIRGLTDIENIVITSQKGVAVYVKDIAVVQETPQPPSGILGIRVKNSDGTATDNNSAIQGIVAMLRGQNPTEVVNGIKEKIKDINENWLPEGVKLKVTYDRSDLVNYTLRTVSHTLVEGISIVLIILILFLGSWRSALVVVLTIPFSLLFAFLMMKLTNIPANLLSLGAIDFGIIVDGAVVMVENIARHYREKHESTDSPIEITKVAAFEVSKEILFSISIIVCAYIPIFTLQRVEGKLFRPMAFTLSYALIGALFASVTAIPVLMSFLFKTESVQSNIKLFQQLEAGVEFAKAKYGLFIDWLLLHHRNVLKITTGLVTVGLIIGALTAGFEFLPNLDEGALNIRSIFPVEMTLKEVAKYSYTIRDLISKHFPSQLVITQVGRNDDGTDPYGPNRMEVLVGIKDFDLWKDMMSKPELITKLKQEFKTAVPGVMFSFSQPILDNVTEAVTGSVADLAVMINGRDTTKMREVAKKIKLVLEKIPGASEVGVEQEPDQAQLVVDIDRKAAARFGINVADVQKMIEAAIGGSPIGELYDGEKRFGIVARYSTTYRASVEAINRLLIQSASGNQVPLAELANIKMVSGPTIVQRQDGSRQISVRANIRGRDQGSFVSEAQKEVQKQIKIPHEFKLVWGGQFENLTRAFKRLAIAIPITIAIICAILGFLYKDRWNVMVVLSCIPFSLVGGLYGLLLRGYHFNVSAGVGFISLFGIATMSGVLFVSRAHHVHVDHPEADLKTIARLAAVAQFRPRVMTLLLALLGLVPASLAGGIGSDIQRPLATVVVGGLISSLLLTVSILPVLYYYLETKRAGKTT